MSDPTHAIRTAIQTAEGPVKAGLMTGDQWLKWHTNMRWLRKMEADGPPPAPSPSLVPVFKRRHEELCAERRARLTLDAPQEAEE